MNTLLALCLSCALTLVQSARVSTKELVGAVDGLNALDAVQENASVDLSDDEEDAVRTGKGRQGGGGGGYGKNDDGLCHCLKRKFASKVDWDDQEKKNGRNFNQYNGCLKKCPRACKREGKHLNGFPFFKCLPEGGKFECNCLDFHDTLEDVQKKKFYIRTVDQLYKKIFKRWNTDVDAGEDTVYFERKDDIKDCFKDCEHMCDKVNPNLMGICTISHADIDD